MNDRIIKNKVYLNDLKKGKPIYGKENKMVKWNPETKMIDVYMYLDADCLVDTKTSIDEDTFLKTF